MVIKQLLLIKTFLLSVLITWWGLRYVSTWRCNLSIGDHQMFIWLLEGEESHKKNDCSLMNILKPVLVYYIPMMDRYDKDKTRKCHWYNGSWICYIDDKSPSIIGRCFLLQPWGYRFSSIIIGPIKRKSKGIGNNTRGHYAYCEVFRYRSNMHCVPCNFEKKKMNNIDGVVDLTFSALMFAGPWYCNYGVNSSMSCNVFFCICYLVEY